MPKYYYTEFLIVQVICLNITQVIQISLQKLTRSIIILNVMHNIFNFRDKEVVISIILVFIKESRWPQPLLF